MSVAQQYLEAACYDSKCLKKKTQNSGIQTRCKARLLQEIRSPYSLKNFLCLFLQDFVNMNVTQLLIG